MHGNDFTRYFVVTAGCFATLLTPFLLTLNNHSIAAASAVFALYPFMRILLDQEQKKRYFLLAGFFAMLTCCNELPAALFGLIVFGLLFKTNPRFTCLVFIPAALVPFNRFLRNKLCCYGRLETFLSILWNRKISIRIPWRSQLLEEPTGTRPQSGFPTGLFLPLHFRPSWNFFPLANLFTDSDFLSARSKNKRTISCALCSGSASYSA